MHPPRSSPGREKGMNSCRVGCTRGAVTRKDKPFFPGGVNNFVRWCLPAGRVLPPAGAWGRSRQVNANLANLANRPPSTLRLVGTGPPERGRRDRRAAPADVERRDELHQEPGPLAAWGRADVLAGVEDERDRAALLLVDDADPGRVGDVRVRAFVPPKIPGGVEDVWQ